jgi:hypothetical protein
MRGIQGGAGWVSASFRLFSDENRFMSGRSEPIVLRRKRGFLKALKAPSIWLAIAWAALLVLEIQSTSGRFLDRYGADVMTGWLGQCVLLGIFIDAVRGALPREMISIPVLIYSGYYFVFWQQGIHIGRKSEELGRQNPGLILAFDPKLHSLLTDDADLFAASYSIPVAYARDPSIIGDEYVSYRLLSRDKVNQYLSRNSGGAQILSVYIDDVLQPNVKEIRIPERPRLGVITATAHDEPGEGWKDWNIGVHTTSLSLDGRFLGTFNSGYARRLLTFPFFTVRCKSAPGSPARRCYAEFATELKGIESRPPSVNRTLYDSPVSIMLGLKRRSEDELAGSRGVDSDPSVRPAPGEDEAFEALRDVIDGRTPVMSWTTGSLVVGNAARLAPFASGIAKRFVELTMAGSADLPEPHEQMELLATGMAGLGPVEFGGVQDQLADLVRKESIRKDFPLIYLRLAHVGPKLYSIYRDQFLDKGANTTDKLLAALAICRIGQADSEVVDAMNSEWAKAGAGTAEDSNYKAALFVSLLNLGQEANLNASARPGSRALQSWYDAVLSGQGKTKVGPNNCMPTEWPFNAYVPFPMAPRLRWMRQQWRAPG